METWREYNYYTRDPKQWVKLMNLSTTEWGIGYLPPDLYAIPGSLNSSYKVPPNSTVIQNAAKTEVGSRHIEKIIFGVASGLVVLWALVWLWFRRAKLLGKPETVAINLQPDPEHGSQGTSITIFNNPNAVEEEHLEIKLQHFYYESNKSENEVREKDVLSDGFSTEDVELATKLLRDMYRLDLRLFSTQSSPGVPQADRNRWMCQSDAILTELRRLAVSWMRSMEMPEHVGNREKEREMQEIMSIIDTLGTIPPERYPNKQPLVTNSQRSRYVNGSSRR